jgi:hypothetical protein
MNRKSRSSLHIAKYPTGLSLERGYFRIARRGLRGEGKELMIITETYFNIKPDPMEGQRKPVKVAS